MSFHDRFDYSAWLEKGEYSKGPLTSRTLTTIYGEVRYWRTYLIRKEGGGFYPVDAGIGLTGDGFSPLVMSLAEKGKAIGAKTQRERDWLAAIEEVYKDYDTVDQDTRSLNYEKAMEQLTRKYPHDVEAKVF